MRRNNSKVVYVLLSGGIDSTACVYHYLKLHATVRPLFVDYGQPAAQAELRSAHDVATFYKLTLRTVRICGIKMPRSGEITGRNALLLMAALTRAKAKAVIIAMGIHAGTRYFDCQPHFFELCQRIVSGYTDGRTQVGAPFLDWTKVDIRDYCIAKHVPVNLTWSCEARSDMPCEECLSCKDREALFARS